MSSNPPPERPEPEGGARQLLRRFLVPMFLLSLALLVLFGRFPQGDEVPYSQLKQDLRGGRVAELVIKGHAVHGTYRSESATSGKPEAAKPFRTTMPSFDDPELMKLIEEKGVTLRVQSEDAGWLSQLMFGVLPFVLLFLFLFYSGRSFRQQMGDVGERLTGFGRSRAKRFEKSRTRIGFDDVAGLANAKRDLTEIVAFLKDPTRFEALGAKIPRGVLLMGPPGTGKTLLSKAVAGEAEVPFFSISGSEFVELFVGVGASRVRDLFESAKKEAPAIIFVDEIDAVGRARGTGLGGGHDEREQTLNQILSEMDGFGEHEAVVVIAATNRPDVLDSALLRPGRFDRKVTLDLPQREARRQILAVHTRKVPLSDDVDLDDVAKRTVGFSGADLENLVNEAALLAARKGKKKVAAEEFEAARDRVLFGGERDEKIVEREKSIVAVHEAGHALVAKLLPGTDPLARVSIIPRGRSLGATEQSPDEDRMNVSRSYVEARIAVALGGRVAERLVEGEVSSGAEDDLKQVTRLARRMVCQWGMSDVLGPVSLRHGEEHVFLGREMAQPKDFSEATARLIDEEVGRIVRAQEERVEALLGEHRPLLERLARALVERETLSAAEVDALLDEKPVVALADQARNC